MNKKQDSQLGPKTWSDAELQFAYQKHCELLETLVEFCCAIPSGMAHYDFVSV